MSSESLAVREFPSGKWEDADGITYCEHVPKTPGVGTFEGWGWVYVWGSIKIFTCRRPECYPSRRDPKWIKALRIIRSRGLRSRSHLRDQRTALYRHFDHAGGLLYVGITRDPDVRLKQHLKGPFGFQIARTDVEWFDTRDDAEVEERRAIWNEFPEYNTRGRR